MHQLLTQFFGTFSDAFSPSQPYRGNTGTNWLVSRVWSDDIRFFLNECFNPTYEVPVPGGRRRLDAALRSDTGEFCYAIEWEWDHKQVNRAFATNDFLKIMEVEARCGIAIVHTRADGQRGNGEADQSISRLLRAHQTHNEDHRPVGLIEIRRTDHAPYHVEFRCTLTDLGTGEVLNPIEWRFE